MPVYTARETRKNNDNIVNTVIPIVIGVIEMANPHTLPRNDRMSMETTVNTKPTVIICCIII